MINFEFGFILILVTVYLSLLNMAANPQGKAKKNNCMEDKLFSREKLAEVSPDPGSIQLLRQLARGIAHDYNNILTVILGNLTLARSYSSIDAEILEIIIDVEKAIQKAKEITESLIEFSRDRNLVFKPGHTREIVTRIAAEEFPADQATIEFAVEDDLWSLAFDAHCLTTIVSYIFKFIKSESRARKSLCIEIANAEKEGRKWQRISLIDRKLILLNDRIASLFHPKFSIKKEDFGIGLIGAYALILKHGGAFSLSSDVGRGTTFNLYFPID